jgi:GNAT superfamily N-acetyltransferase
MLKIEQIDTNSKADVRRFVNIPYRLYANHPQWVPPFISDVNLQLNKQKHPFYEHSFADFFIASRDGRDVGRIGALEYTRFNDYHHSHKASFYLFECEDDQEAANALFERVFEWARQRNLDTVIGPKGFGALDGYGIQVEGFEHRQLMNMMNYNYPYYQRLVENIGFEKEVDFVSCYLRRDVFHLPERIHRVADRVRQRTQFAVKTFTTKKELRAWADRIGAAYNKSFVNNWEYAPLTEKEIKQVLDNILLVADPRLIKIITYDNDAVGFLFGFPDLSAAMQRAKGHLNPLSIADLLLELKRTKWVAMNGVGVLPEYKGRGGAVLLYTEMEKTLQDYQYIHADLTQVAETAVEMRHDLENLGGKPYKNHRVYRKVL